LISGIETLIFSGNFTPCHLIPRSNPSRSIVRDDV
jgi:hypothetical protein